MSEEQTTEPQASSSLYEAIKASLDHQKRGLREIDSAFKSLIPTPFRKHCSNARREFRQSAKVIIRATLHEIDTRLDRDDEVDQPASQPMKVKVQVD